METPGAVTRAFEQDIALDVALNVADVLAKPAAHNNNCSTQWLGLSKASEDATGVRGNRPAAQQTRSLRDARH